MTLYIGLMSGTSMDGIDAALVDMPSNTLVAGITKKYSDEVKSLLNNLVNEVNVSLAAVCQLNTLIGREFASAVHALLNKAKVDATDIIAIGSHGQTVCHNPVAPIPYTLQLGCAHTIAALTQIKVVADFRTRDLVHGGQGAPFAPLYHKELFVTQQDDLAVVNIGGIANISFINPEGNITGWDVGPGNCLMDAWILKHQGVFYDTDGTWASQGLVIDCLLNNLLSDPFFSLMPPKSIGKEYFSLIWLEHHLLPEYTPVDVMATISALTAHAIADTISGNVRALKQVYLCGGGTHNLHLKNTLNDLLPNLCVSSCAERGISPDYLEAMMFAWFSWLTINEIPVNLTQITGSKCHELLGAIYPITKSIN
jgi:anhydro-N-acetylmuramic acid kinase